jgi:hypothetical protein
MADKIIEILFVFGLFGLVFSVFVVHFYLLIQDTIQMRGD